MQIKYEPHPVTPERKAELVKQGYKIIDARFNPEPEKSEPVKRGKRKQKAALDENE